MPQFTILQLEPEELARAWPLVRLVAPWLDPDGWQQSAEKLLSSGGGVIAVVAPDGCFHGLATYELTRRRTMGQALVIRTFVTFELSRRAPVKAFLCDAIERISAALGCDAIVIAEPPGGYVPASWLDANRQDQALDGSAVTTIAGAEAGGLLFGNY